MWKRINLRTRIFVLLTGLVLITVAGALVTVWYTYQMEEVLTHVIGRNMAAFQAAEALENALVNQKGFVSYYFLDGDPDWLRQLGEYRQIFKVQLDKVFSFVETTPQEEGITLIQSEYDQYTSLKDQVIAHYRAGEREAGSKLHRTVRSHFFKTLELCDTYKDLQAGRIGEAKRQSHIQAKRLRITAGSAILTALCLAVLLAFILINHILGSVRRLTLETDRKGLSNGSGDEVEALSQSVRGLIEDMNHTHSELERSRETLLQSEKMALVGKLAAGTAHSIRNPLTSVKMRLFSLSRTLDLSDPQREDFEVISQEIRHIDTIVQNFLEFSRPPKLMMQTVSPSDIVDSAIQLLKHRIQSYDVDIRLNREEPLPELQADPEQLKEVIVNLVVNACEAMEGGGTIVIQEEIGFEETSRGSVVIRLADDGPGIPESVQERILEPFFTTKEEGTGLGLSIAGRIIEQHGGSLTFTSKEGGGTTFIITLPT